MTWTRRIPTRPGYYLRVNAGHRISLHLIAKAGRGLSINWGWGGEGGFLFSRQKRWKYKLSGWQWYGPIPEPNIEGVAKL